MSVLPVLLFSLQTHAQTLGLGTRMRTRETKRSETSTLLDNKLIGKAA